MEGAFNAVVADVGAAGPFFFEGRGAGEAPTASAVIADLVDIARGRFGPAFGVASADEPPRAVITRIRGRIAPLGFLSLRFEVLDEPGVLAGVARKLADSGVSIESMIQRGRAHGEPVAIVMLTHDTPAPRRRAPCLEGRRRLGQGAGTSPVWLWKPGRTTMTKLLGPRIRASRPFA